MPKRFMAEAKNLMAEHAFRFTSEREAILNVLVSTHGSHPTADDIYMATRAEHPNIGLATVYRALDLFNNIGIVVKSDLGGGSARYELNPGLRESDPSGSHLHHHLVCVKCGRVQEFNEDLLEDLERVIASKVRFKILDHNLKFFGHCERCALGDDASGRRPVSDAGA